MEKKVIVLTPNGRRQNVRVTPNTTLLQILEEACQKHGFDSDEHCLKHHNKEVDLSQMFRFSGLPNNCLLEMVQTGRKRIATHVDICVQLEDGSRNQGQFTPNDNVWHVVEQLSGEAAASFASPIAIYMRQDIIGRQKIAQTTLKSLGITEGRAMIRFIDKLPEELRTQANVYKPPTPRETTKEENTAPRATQGHNLGTSGGFAITRDLVQSLKAPADVEKVEPEGGVENVKNESTAVEEKPKYDWGTGTGRSIRSDMELAAQDAAERAERERHEAELVPEPEVHIIGERNAIVYSLDTTQKRIEDLPDSFFDLTVHDLKLVLRDLKKIATGNEDAPMLTEKLRELQENKTMLNKIAQYKNCVIRIKFPDRHVLQGIFKPIDTIVTVMEFVRKFLLHPEQNFQLFTIPPKNVLPLDKTLLELDFVPTAVLHFGFVDDASISEVVKYIKSEYLQKLTTVEGAFYAASKFRISNRRTTIEESDNDSVTLSYESRSSSASTGAIPKRPRGDNVSQST